jgi:hypothetical protein
MIQYIAARGIEKNQSRNMGYIQQDSAMSENRPSSRM